MGEPWFRTSLCRSCDARVIFARTESGRNMPVDAKPSPEGSVELFRRGDLVHARVVPRDARAGRADLRSSHFETCPHAEQHRTR